MHIPRLDDELCFLHTAESINMIVSMLYNGIQLFLFMTIVILGCSFNKLGELCFYICDKGLDKTGRKCILNNNGKDPCLIRYNLLFRNIDESTNFNICIHQILKSDNDFHDQSCRYLTCILSGGYWETIVELDMGDDKDDEDEIFINTRYWRAPGFIQTLNNKCIHRIDLEMHENKEVPCWALVIPYSHL